MRPMLFLASFCLAAPIAVFGAEPPKTESPQFAADDLNFFETKIRPVLVNHCYECHSADADEPSGGLLLDSRSGLLLGGDSGPAVKPGDAAASRLIEAIRYTNEAYQMPPEGKLPDGVVGDFERWIDRGMADPREGGALVKSREIDFDEARKFWSLRPLVRPPIPHVKNASWSSDPIDRFVLARLEQNKLAPAADADRRTLVRRLYFDLIGLPPSPEEIEAFLADDSPEAIERLVDRLLASPRFGERWGRHWLDVARFAESTGGGRSLVHREAWRYRDYVIESFSSDKPFNQFIAEQIAGDLLPFDSPKQQADQIVATGFLVLGPHNYELQDKDLLRMDVVDEQIDVIGRAFLGMSIGCARCHDHKFDPIPTRDYYALAGILRSTKSLRPGNVSGNVLRELPRLGKETQLAKEYRKKRESLDRRWRQANERVTNAELELAAAYGANDADRWAGLVIDDIQARIVGDWKRSTHEPTFVGQGYLHDDNAEKGKKSVVFSPELPSAGTYEVRVSYTPGTNRAPNAPVTIHYAGGEKTIRIDQRNPAPINRRFVSVGEYRFNAGRGAQVTVGNQDAQGVVIADAVQFVSADVAAIAPGDKTSSDADSDKQANANDEVQRRIDSLVNQVTARRSEARRLEKQLATLKKESPRAPKAMSVEEEAAIENCRICIRGNVRNLGDEAPRGFLTVVGAFPSIPADQSGRLQLAEWLASRDNPLTVRVLANRLWHHLFGRGICPTNDDFGHAGQEPTHADLLDHLAVDLLDDGWSIKRAIRRIVLSRTYRMASDEQSPQEKIDPENRLFWRQNRRRLQAEPIRDAMLASAGLLDLRQGGSDIPADRELDQGLKISTTRRAVYVPVFRNSLDDGLSAFDVANPNLAIGKRSVSVLPTQALYLMNSPEVVGWSRSFAARLLAEKELSDEQRLDLAYRLALGRVASASERTATLDYLRRHADASGADKDRVEAWAGVCHALFACIDFRYLR